MNYLLILTYCETINAGVLCQQVIADYNAHLACAKMANYLAREHTRDLQMQQMELLINNILVCVSRHKKKEIRARNLASYIFVKLLDCILRSFAKDILVSARPSTVANRRCLMLIVVLWQIRVDSNSYNIQG